MAFLRSAASEEAMDPSPVRPHHDRARPGSQSSLTSPQKGEIPSPSRPGLLDCGSLRYCPSLS
jgi:hypothetical protein